MEELDNLLPANIATRALEPRALAALHLAISLVLVAADVALGLYGNSKALAMLAAYALQTCISASVLLLASSARVRAPSARHPFGLGQLEFLATLGLSLVVVLVVGGLTAAAMHNLLDHPQRAPLQLALWGAAGTLVVCWCMGRQAHGVARSASSPVVGAHADLLRAQTFAALVVLATVVLGRAGLDSTDFAVAIAEGLHVVWCTGRLLRRSIKGLLDGSVEPALLRGIAARITAVHPPAQTPSVRAVQRGQDLFISATVDVDGSISLADAEQLRRRIARSLGHGASNVKEVLVDFTPARGQGDA